MPEKAITDFCGTTDLVEIAERFPRWAAKIEQEELSSATKEIFIEKEGADIQRGLQKTAPERASERKNRL